MQRVLVISVVVNVVCLAALLWSLSKMQSLESRSILENKKKIVIDKSNLDRTTVAERAVREVEPFHWSQIEAQDYQTYIENLRRIGCPEETIQDLVKRDLDQHYDQLKATALNKGTTRNDYWATGHPNALSQPSINTRSELAQLDQEKSAVLKDLFGVEGLAEINRSSPYARAKSKAKTGYAMDFIPDETMAELNSMEQEFGSKLLKKMASGTSDAQDRSEIRMLREARENQIASMLTPEQKLEYDLRKSPTAANLRLQLDGFDPSEDEFRNIFQIQKKFEDDHGVISGATISPVEVQERRLAEQDMKNDMRSMLGEDRFQDYLQQTDYDYKSIDKITQRQGLADNVSAQIYQMKSEAEELARGIRLNSGVPIGERQQQLQQIYNETSRSIESIMGQQGAASIQAQGGGRNWLNNLGRINPQPITQPTFQVITGGSP
ncbi:MAG: hypothetical protein CMO44_00375 [Verrucomicrobiales bacterium]|nr:hypothetical protein [Verrucomicrobiales bacterium]